MVDWSKFGVSQNQFPYRKGAQAYRLTGDLLIVGGGRCVWDDFNSLGRKWSGDIMCINDMVMHFPLPVKHAYSNDSRMVPRWIKARRPRYRVLFQETILPHSNNGFLEGEKGYVWPFRTNNSGLTACLVGFGMGYDSITLIGNPLDNSGHYFDPPWVETKLLREVPEGNEWVLLGKMFKGRIKSLSGRTKEFLNGIL